MKRFSRPLAAASLITALLLSAAGSSAAVEERVSRPGEYRGYSEAIYDGWDRTSRYVAVRDGTRLAIDIYRPTKDGELETEPLPVLWMHTPYNRRTFRGELAAERYPGEALSLLPYGYVVAVADFRGLYASFGRNGAFNRGEWLEAARWDAYDITEWLADQPWSSGKIGMWGCSATGGSQLQAATTAPPSLEAIFPMSCEFDVYSFGARGGVAPERGTTRQSQARSAADAGARRDAAAVPVDGDEDREQLEKAIAEHADNIASAGSVPFRDSVSSTLDVRWWQQSSPHTYLEELKSSGIAVYVAANWEEGATKYGSPFTYRNLRPRSKLIFGPAGHCEWRAVREDTGFDLVVEERRFFDHWLKGIDNDVMDEPPVTYYTYNAPPGTEWRSADAWPLPEEKRVRYYLGPTLATDAPTAGDVRDTNTVDYDLTGENRAEQGFSYVSEPLADDLQITGHPLLHLWASSSATDGDFFAVLEDLAPDDTAVSHFVDGQLRASHRALHEPPYDNLSLPWHRSNESDAQSLTPGEPVELVVDLYPISYVFPAGHRLRLTITNSSRVTPRLDPPPQVTVYRDAARPSFLELPVIPGGES